MAKFIYDPARDCMVDRETGLPMLNQEERAAPPAMPRISPDYPGYASPIDGSWIEGRRARRYDLEKNGCVDARDMPTLGGKIRSPKFAKKHGLEKHLEQ